MKLIIRFLVMFCLLLVGVDGYSLYANPNVVSYPPADSYNVAVNTNVSQLSGNSSASVRPVNYEASRKDETAVSSDEDEDEDEEVSYKKAACALTGVSTFNIPVPAGVAARGICRQSSFYRHFAYLSSTRYILYRVIRL